MLNRRTVSRYHLVHPLVGYIEHGEVRRRGEVVEMSTAGCRFRLRNTAKDAFIAQKSPLDFGEILYKDQTIGGFGDIRYVRAEGGDVLIGFKWDDVHADANVDRHFSIIAELIAEKGAGCVNLNGGVVELIGHVFAALLEDIKPAIDPKRPRISLRECTSIDASGLALLTALEKAKVRIEDAGSEIGAIFQRYKLEGLDSLSPLFPG